MFPRKASCSGVFYQACRCMCTVVILILPSLPVELWHHSIVLQALFVFCSSKGFSQESYELVVNFPRRTLTSLDPGSTIKEARLHPQETIFVQARWMQAAPPESAGYIQEPANMMAPGSTINQARPPSQETVFYRTRWCSQHHRKTRLHAPSGNHLYTSCIRPAKTVFVHARQALPGLAVGYKLNCLFKQMSQVCPCVCELSLFRPDRTSWIDL